MAHKIKSGSYKVEGGVGKKSVHVQVGDRVPDPQNLLKTLGLKRT